MFTVIVTWTVAPERAQAFATLLAQQARNSLAREEGCSRFDVCQDPQATGSFVLYETYDDEAAFQAHLASDHYAAFAAQADPLTLSKQVRTLTRIAG